MARFVSIPAHYDRKKDRSEVDQVGFLDLHKAYVEGVLSGAANYDDFDFNQADPTAMLHRPHDIFEAMRQKDYVKSVLSAASADAKSET